MRPTPERLMLQSSRRQNRKIMTPYRGGQEPPIRLPSFVGPVFRDDCLWALAACKNSIGPESRLALAWYISQTRWRYQRSAAPRQRGQSPEALSLNAVIRFNSRILSPGKDESDLNMSTGLAREDPWTPEEAGPKFFCSFHRIDLL
jgi:hypothetical protein